MHNDSINDLGPPYDPETIEGFLLRGAEEFEDWWNALAPPGSCDGIRLDYETARIVWQATYEHQIGLLALVYDSAEVHATAKTVAEIELGYVVHRYHNGFLSVLLASGQCPRVER